MLIKIINISRGERVKIVNGNDYSFTMKNGIISCEVPSPDCDVFMSHPELFEEVNDEVGDVVIDKIPNPITLDLSEIDTNDLDAVIEFANSVQDEVVYTRRNKRENILNELVLNGY